MWDVCSTCSAVVADKAAHALWHQNLTTASSTGTGVTP